MAARPVDEVRGTHLRLPVEQEELILPQGAWPQSEQSIKEVRAVMQDGRAIAILTGLNGDVTRIDLETGSPISSVMSERAQQIVEKRIEGGEKVVSAQFFDADASPFDFRRHMPVWQVVLDGGTHVYVGRDTGEIEAVRTRWWRVFDFAWGLHIMDLRTREETSHPILIAFAALGLIGSIIGCILMFRRRKTRAFK